MLFIALGLAFILELIVLAAFSCLGLLLDMSPAIKIASSLLFFATFVAFWGMFMAPKAAHRFHPPAYYFSKTLLYSLAAVVIWQKMSIGLVVLFVVSALIDELYLFRYNPSMKWPIAPPK